MMLRKHQIQTSKIVDGIISGSSDYRGVTDIVALVTPGGGKSWLPQIVGRLIEARLADAICWVVPRLNLQYQAEANFIDPEARRIIGHNLTIRASTNEPDPCRGMNGFTTTFQALGINAHHAIEDFSKKRYILVLDEFHHLGIDREWSASIEILYRMAKYRLLMSGGIDRGDSAQVSFLNYESIDSEFCRPVLKDSQSTRIIRYSRQDALKERAIIPIKAILHSGSASWRDRDGHIYEYGDFSRARGKYASAAIYTAINTEFADELIEQSMDHWARHHMQFPSSKILNVAYNIESACRIVDYLRSSRMIQSDIATSADSIQAKEAIKRFKNGQRNCLTGVAMFYEGFDCKQVSHINCLTNIRSKSWIEQMIARAVRPDPAIPYEKQVAHIFAPDDIFMREIIHQLEIEQTAFCKLTGDGEKKEAEQIELFDCEVDGDKIKPVDPLDSSLAGRREFLVGNHSGETEIVSPTAPQTQSDIEAALRRDIEFHVRKYCAQVGINPYVLNSNLKEQFGKNRALMTVPELRRLKEFLTINYRIKRDPRPARRVWTNQVDNWKEEQPIFLE